ncbi:hypothetical protein N7536_005421 [Penicillium majusculum]|nr:hypothetical protein N7536_005421 [Penicillium majusculum]
MVATFIDINPRTPLLKQLEEQPEAGSCVLVNTFHIPAGKTEEAFAALKAYYDLPEFKESLKNYPDETESRIVLYRKQHTDGICLS